MTSRGIAVRGAVSLVVGLSAMPAPAGAQTSPSRGGACARTEAAFRDGKPALAIARFNACQPGDPDFAAARAAARKAEATRESQRFAPVTIVVADTPTAKLSLSTFPGEALPASVELWLPFGTHTAIAQSPGGATVTVEILVEDGDRRTVILRLPAAGASQPDAAEVDFSEEGAGEPRVVGDPEKLKYQSLLPDRYKKRRGIEPGARDAVTESTFRLGFELGLGLGAFSEGGDSVFAARVGARIRYQPGLWFADAGLGVAWRGGSSGGDAERIVSAAADLRGGVRGRLGEAWHVHAAIGPALHAALQSEVGGADTVPAALGVSAELGVSRGLGSASLGLALRAELGLSSVADGAGRQNAYFGVLSIAP